MLDAFVPTLFLRVFVAALCGLVIGYERESRLKAAGLRTHIIVALASALMMVVSKYGFYDVIKTQGISLDPSRVAASIVSGVGFLGAGTIFMKKKTVTGLTTAAGIWATSGIGMAVGAGMYFEGLFATVIVLLTQHLSHSKFFTRHIITVKEITINLDKKICDINSLVKMIELTGSKIYRLKTAQDDDSIIIVKLFVRLSKDYTQAMLADVISNTKGVRKITM